MSIPDPIVLLDARAKYVHPAFRMTRASTKTVFDAAGRLVTVPANALGWDHDPATGQSRGYLAEPSATNLLLHSNDLSQSEWSKPNASVTGDAITGPDGQGMDKLVEDNSNNYHGVRQSLSITDGSDITASFIGKADERGGVRFYLQNADEATYNARMHVNLRDGVITDQSVSLGITLIGVDVVHLGGGFYFAWMAANLGPGVDSVRVEWRMLDDNNNSDYQGDGTSGLYLGYCQVEEGSYPTSYIETGGATATRAEDSLVLSGLGDFPWWAGERGAVFIEYQLFGTRGAGHFFEISDGQLEVRFNIGGAGVICAGAAVEGALLIQPEQARIFTRKKHAFTFDAEEYASVWNGGGLVSGARIASFTYPASLTLASGPPIPGHIMRAVYYPARISNADLQSLTAIQE